MRIGIDLTALLPQPTGVDRYLLQLVRHLAEIDAENRYTVFVDRAGAAALDGLPSSFVVRPVRARPRPLRFAFQQAALPVAGTAARLDVLHSPSFFLPLARGRQRHLLTVHDMTSFTHRRLHERLRASWPYRAAIAASILRADLVSVPSGFVAGELRRIVTRLDEKRVRIIPYGVGREFGEHAGENLDRVRSGLGLPSRYVLCVGTIEPRKNVETLLAAYRELLRDGCDSQLVLAGRLGWGYRDVLAQLEEPPLRGRVHLTGYVDAADLPAVYAGATALVYPSRVEGFGFPPLEAMATGVPVVASDTSALAENLSGAAELVPAGDVAALAAALRRILRDPDLRKRRRAEGLRRAAEFTWGRTARETRACYEELARR